MKQGGESFKGSKAGVRVDSNVMFVEDIIKWHGLRIHTKDYVKNMKEYMVKNDIGCTS